MGAREQKRLSKERKRAAGIRRLDEKDRTRLLQGGEDDRAPLVSLERLPLLVAAAYYANPIAAFTNSRAYGGGSLRGIWDALLVFSLMHAAGAKEASDAPSARRGKRDTMSSSSKAALFLALATYADWSRCSYGGDSSDRPRRRRKCETRRPPPRIATATVTGSPVYRSSSFTAPACTASRPPSRAAPHR